MSDPEILFWVDLETDGLAPDANVLQVAAIPTDVHGQELSEPFEAIISYTELMVDWMRRLADPVVRDMHDKTGLWSRLFSFDARLRGDVERVLFSYLVGVAPDPRQAQLAGNSVHMDKLWLSHSLPRVHDHLHYKLVDVTALATTMMRWGVIDARHPFEGTEHNALDDIRGAIAEYRWLRGKLVGEEA